jgi:twitching motility protein PilT
LHTRGAAAAVNRIVDVFPAGQQAHVRTMLADALAGVVSQELLPRLGGGRVPCVEILIATSAIRALIREGKTHQIDNVMQMSARDGMRTRSAHLSQLYASQSIEKPTKSCASPHSA